PPVLPALWLPRRVRPAPAPAGPVPRPTAPCLRPRTGARHSRAVRRPAPSRHTTVPPASASPPFSCQGPAASDGIRRLGNLQRRPRLGSAILLPRRTYVPAAILMPFTITVNLGDGPLDGLGREAAAQEKAAEAPPPHLRRQLLIARILGP